MKSTSYTLKNLAKNTGYHFRVRVPGKSFVAAPMIYTLGQVDKLNVKKAKKKKVTVSWKKAEGVSGYQISISSKKSKTSIKATVSAKSSKKTLKVSKGKTYYYKIRTFKTVNGKKIYGPWSAAKKFKR